MNKKNLFQKLYIRGRPAGKSGFTLVEVIVTLVITIVVIAISSTLIITGTNLFARSAQRDVQANIAETVLGFVSDQLLYARGIEEFQTNPPTFGSAGNAAVLQIKQNDSTDNSHTRGQLFFRRAGDDNDPINIFGSNFYQSYDVELDIVVFHPAGGGNASMTVTVKLYNNNNLNPNPVMTRTTTRPLLNYEQGEKTIPDPDLGWFSIYYIPS